MTNTAIYILVGALLVDSAMNLARIVVIVWATKKSERERAMVSMENDERIRAAASVMSSVAVLAAQEAVEETKRRGGI